MVQPVSQTEQSEASATPLDTEKRILQTAREVFRQKGFGAARMQEIADRAGINKASLHYYFRSKQLLFERIFLEAFGEISHIVNDIMLTEEPMRLKIERFVEHYNAFLSANPDLPAFIIGEMARDPEYLMQLVAKSIVRPDVPQVLQLIQTEVADGKMVEINPLDLIINLIGLSIFPYAARPMIRSLSGLDDTTYDFFLSRRPAAIREFVLRAVGLE